MLIDEQQDWTKRWVAGNVPGWTNVEVGLGARYQPRYLSNVGRLFFNSNDALVPQDVNGNEDVYEYEPQVIGSCSSGANTGSTVYEPARSFEGEGGKGESAAGCVGLISSGTSLEESAFLEASENGEDVFFLSSARLQPQDLDNAFDVYDAHVCSAAVPCTSPVASPPVCTTADACRAAPSPQPGIYGAPASATFSGVGNLTPVPPGPKVETRAQKLTKALAQCHKDRAKKKRAKCEATAKKKYGPLKKAKKAKKSNHGKGSK